MIGGRERKCSSSSTSSSARTAARRSRSERVRVEPAVGVVAREAVVVGGLDGHGLGGEREAASLHLARVAGDRRPGARGTGPASSTAGRTGTPRRRPRRRTGPACTGTAAPRRRASSPSTAARRAAPRQRSGSALRRSKTLKFSRLLAARRGSAANSRRRLRSTRLAAPKRCSAAVASRSTASCRSAVRAVRLPLAEHVGARRARAGRPASASSAAPGRCAARPQPCARRPSRRRAPKTSCSARSAVRSSPSPVARASRAAVVLAPAELLLGGRLDDAARLLQRRQALAQVALRVRVLAQQRHRQLRQLEPPQQLVDHAQRLVLLRRHQHALPRRDEVRDGVRDRQRLAGARRALHDDDAVLRPLGEQRDPLLGGVRRGTGSRRSSSGPRRSRSAPRGRARRAAPRAPCRRPCPPGARRCAPGRWPGSSPCAARRRPRRASTSRSPSPLPRGARAARRGCRRGLAARSTPRSRSTASANALQRLARHGEGRRGRRSGGPAPRRAPRRSRRSGRAAS